MKKIANIAAYLFILAVVVLSAISILGVWDFFSKDVITKSFQSIGLLALVAIIILVADHFIDRHNIQPIESLNNNLQPATITPEANPIFKSLRILTLSILILSATLLALLGIMAIWDMLSGEILYRSLASIAIVGFSSLIIVITCLERENNSVLYQKKISGGMIFLIIVLAWIIIPAISRLISLK